MYSTNFPADEFEDAVRQLIDSVNFLTGAKATVEKMIVVSTEDINLMSALDSLADSMKERKNGKDAPKKFKKMIEPANKDGKAGPRSWTNMKTKEVVSARELKRQLAAGDLAVGSAWLNSKGDQYVVLNDSEGWSLVKEPQA